MVSSSASRPRLPATIDVADLDVRGKQIRVEALVGADDRPHNTAGETSARAYTRKYAHSPQNSRSFCNYLRMGADCYKVRKC